MTGALTTTAAQIRRELDAHGYRHVPVYVTGGAPYGDCGWCDTDKPHPACLIVCAAYLVEPTEPEQVRAENVHCCAAALRPAVEWASGLVGFEAATIEVAA